MTWLIVSIIGTAAFAISGAIVAMEEHYDIFGVYILGMITAFGGGAVRNLVIGVPMRYLWEQQELFVIASVLIVAIFYFSKLLLAHWTRWGVYFDAIGLGAFAVQGALLAVQLEMSLFAIMVAAVLTGAGGGVIRDLLAGRRPLIFKSEIYAVWAALGGLLVGLQMSKSGWVVYSYLVFVSSMRIISYRYQWQLPKKELHYK